MPSGISETRNCQNCKNNFTIEPDDFGFYEKIKVPPPTFCPDCRSQRRLAWRNDLSLYSRNCALCQKPIITIYSPESEIIVYCNKCWWSDKWDPKSYGIDYDFSKPFFTQFNELLKRVPHLALMNDNELISGSLNCEYTQDFANGKNCYMVFIAWKIENVMYSYYLTAGKDIMDSMNIKSRSEFLYECIRCAQSYKLKYSQNSKACVDSAFMVDCLNCTDCFMCHGLVSKKYHYKNKKYSREEYLKIVEKYKLDTFTGIENAKNEFNAWVVKQPRRHLNSFRVINCTGDIISDSKNLKECFNIKNSLNCSWVQNGDAPKDSYDMSTGGELSECYEAITCDHSSRNFFGVFSWKDQDVQYTQHCHTSKDLFGCVGLKTSQYCILNKKYSKKEYLVLLQKIVQQMNEMPYVDRINNIYRYGEFFPAELSPFGYNETVAPEQFPVTESEAVKKGYRWQKNIQRTHGKGTLTSDRIPDSIKDVKDSILDEVLVCSNCERNYKIVPNELTLYKKMEVPIPRKCFFCRHADRVKRRNPFKLWHRQCMCELKTHTHGVGKCGVEFETSYSPERPEIVYCEKCYQAEVY